MLFSTVPSEGGAISAASAGGQFSDQNFVLRNNVFLNNNACYAVVNLGSRWYVDSHHPSGVLIELTGPVCRSGRYESRAGCSFSLVVRLAAYAAGVRQPRLLCRR